VPRTVLNYRDSVPRTVLNYRGSVPRTVLNYRDSVPTTVLRYRDSAFGENESTFCFWNESKQILCTPEFLATSDNE
jgi:hypothetical protein